MRTPECSTTGQTTSASAAGAAHRAGVEEQHGRTEKRIPATRAGRQIGGQRGRLWVKNAGGGYYAVARYANRSSLSSLEVWPAQIFATKAVRGSTTSAQHWQAEANTVGLLSRRRLPPMGTKDDVAQPKGNRSARTQTSLHWSCKAFSSLADRGRRCVRAAGHTYANATEGD